MTERNITKSEIISNIIKTYEEIYKMKEIKEKMYDNELEYLEVEEIKDILHMLNDRIKSNYKNVKELIRELREIK